jgi:hypothetical protein
MSVTSKPKHAELEGASRRGDWVAVGALLARNIMVTELELRSAPSCTGRDGRPPLLAQRRVCA